MEKLIQTLEKNQNIEILLVDVKEKSVLFKYCASGSYASVYLTDNVDKPYYLFSTDINIEGYHLRVSSEIFDLNPNINNYK
jgi:hypothetical protein